MTNQHTEPITTTSADINEERLAQLRQLFPEAFTEGKVDFDKLRGTLGDLVDDRPERYSFTWAGKQDAIRILQTPTSATLIPAPDESVDFNNTQNIFIEGDNLEVLKLLYKAYFGRVKMIYIDPPYNTGNDFIYPDNYADPLDTYLQLTGQKDEEGNLLTTNSDTSGRYHSAWLNLMYPRVFLARQLLKNDGVIFISIDKREEANLRILMNEVFGEENFIASVSVVSNLKGRSDDNYIATAHEQILIYHKGEYETFGLPLPEEYLKEYKEKDSEGRAYRLLGLRKRGAGARREDRPNMYYPFFVNPQNGYVALKPTDLHTIKVLPKLSDGSDGRWRWGKSTSQERISEITSRIVSGTDRWDIFQIDYAEKDGDLRRIKPKSIWLEKSFSNEAGTLAYKKLMSASFENPKPPDLIKYCLIQSTAKDDIVLDFFAGSCSTAQAVLELNRQDDGQRRFVLVQLPEPINKKAKFANIAEIGKERIRRVIKQMKAEDEGKLPLEMRNTLEDLGFKVFKLAPSNFRSWEGTAKATPEEFASQMELFTDPLVDGWRPANVIYEIALKEGYSLNCYIQRTAVAGHEVYRINDQEKDQHFYLCLENAITDNLPAKLGLESDALFVCRDKALNDTMAANLALQCRLKTI